MNQSPKKISIPKVNDEWTTVVINKTGIVYTKNGAIKVTLKSQKINGVQIPKSFEVWAHQCYLYVSDTQKHELEAYIHKDKMNEILKTLFVRQLREST